MDTYDFFITNILNTRGRFACGEEYCERHHIIPRCLNGTDDEDNLIDLFAHEHFLAHKLLAKENPDNDSLTYAWCCMAFMKNDYEHRYELTPEEYEEAKIRMSEIRKGSHHTKETREKMSRNHADFKGENHPIFGKSRSEDVRRKMSEAHKGKRNYNVRMVYCPELDEYFWGAKEAEEKYGIYHGNIAKCCSGKYKSAGKHPITGQKLTWKYIDNSNNI